ncbi:DUF2809 domain-containing protein [Pedobacter sp. SYSU D00535]|uniref:ribosomal maturation YjgA family protein n=1 Tax=Pedobacter sp. SYSU D00535 TaxID=2810308 RepID=UPI001A96D6B4|nr:DUF2809 domain-containing protein [Pedobacter sp. SYSU D00535]
MKRLLKFRTAYFLAALLLFATEVLIACFISDHFIRPYGGDFLVVILLYCLLKSVLDLKPATAGLSVLLFSYLIEILQYLDLVHRLGLEGSNIAAIVIGSYFSWLDLLAYTFGIITIIGIDRGLPRNSSLIAGER